jgi:hypothetical protein
VEWQAGTEGGLKAYVDFPTRDYFADMATQRELA